MWWFLLGYLFGERTIIRTIQPLFTIETLGESGVKETTHFAKEELCLQRK